MKLISAHIEDLRTLYINDLKKALDMEEKITKALHGMIDRVTNPELRTALSNHFQETRGHVTKVQALLRRDATEDSSKSCKIIGSLTSEASDTAEDVTNPAVRDIALIGAAQQIEHYEIAIYGTLRRWAEILGLSDDVTVLKSIEAEEGKADKTLSDIAGTVNSMAAAA